MTDVDTSWLGIVEWCQETAPRTAASMVLPVEEPILAQAQRETAMEWPEPLLAWLRLRDGGPICDPEGRVLPGYDPLSAAAIVEEWRGFTRLMGEMGDEQDQREDGAELAGTQPVTYFPPLALPIAADGNGCYLLLDLRTGPLRGCVMELDHDEGIRGPLWSGIEDMLSAVLDSLRNGRPIRFPEVRFKPSYVPLVEQGVLRWDLTD